MKNYIFDIGGVLINYDYNLIINKLSESTAINREKISYLFSDELLFKVETGKISSQNFFIKYVKSLFIDFTYNHWIELFMDNYSINTPGLDLLLKLNKNNKIYILSNLAEFNKLALERKFPDLFLYADHNFFSYELGLHKPDPAVYLKILNKINCEPIDCIFFDDNYKNILGAEKTGIKGILFSNERIEEIITGI